MATGQQRQSSNFQPRQQAAPDDGEFQKLIKDKPVLQLAFEECQKAEPKMEECLPGFMKGQSKRLIHRAMMTMQANPDLQDIPQRQFARLVVEAAELGFAIDGKNVYIVNFKGKWQLMPSYKAMVAFCKRCGTILDVQADVVRTNDVFEHGRENGGSRLIHTYDLTADRGNVIGAYCRVWLPSGLWNYALMSKAELDAIQDRAASKKGPWSTDADEMRKKTVIRRLLKMYQDDPGVSRLMELTGWEDEQEAVAKEEGQREAARLMGKPLSRARREQPEPPQATPETDPPPPYSEALAADWLGAAKTPEALDAAANALDALEGADRAAIGGMYDEAKAKLKGTN